MLAGTICPICMTPIIVNIMAAVVILDKTWLETLKEVTDTDLR